MVLSDDVTFDGYTFWHSNSYSDGLNVIGQCPSLNHHGESHVGGSDMRFKHLTTIIVSSALLFSVTSQIAIASAPVTDTKLNVMADRTVRVGVVQQLPAVLLLSQEKITHPVHQTLSGDGENALLLLLGIVLLLTFTAVKIWPSKDDGEHTK